MIAGPAGLTKPRDQAQDLFAHTVSRATTHSSGIAYGLVPPLPDGSQGPPLICRSGCIPGDLIPGAHGNSAMPGVNRHASMPSNPWTSRASPHA